MSPGLAAHRHSASKTRVNALMALRSIRGTPKNPMLLRVPDAVHRRAGTQAIGKACLNSANE